jgi:hypothetical protein
LVVILLVDAHQLRVAVINIDGWLREGALIVGNP